MPASLPELLKITVEKDGSDLHLTTNTPPQVRVHGKETCSGLLRERGRFLPVRTTRRDANASDKIDQMAFAFSASSNSSRISGSCMVRTI